LRSVVSQIKQFHEAFQFIFVFFSRECGQLDISLTIKRDFFVCLPEQIVGGNK
jgi:hypothetical protein